MSTSSPFSSSAGTKVGLEIWRIEKLSPVPVDLKTFGSFHSGDAYILLSTVQKGPSKQYDLHFWLGSKSSQDEQGGAALLSITLDDQLGGKPVQHREVEGHESPLFLSYFPKGIVYLSGGVESAFNKIDPDKYRCRLFHCKGKRNIRCTEVELKSSSLNEGDVFILDQGLTIYQWNGSSSNKFEKTKGLEIATKIKDDERGGKAKIIHLESGKDDQHDSFWKLLGGKEGIKSAIEGGDDEGIKLDIIKLFRLSDASGSLIISPIAEGKLEKKMLDDNDAFLIDSGSSIFVWVGKGASKEERKKSLLYGQQYLMEKNRPLWTPLTRVISGGEPPVFKASFFHWDEPKIITADPSLSTGKKTEKTVNISALYQQKTRQAEEKMIDNNGTIEIFRIQDFNRVPLDKVDYGHFYSGDSYIIIYTYKSGIKESRIIYFWQGRQSSIDEKASSALLTIELDKQYGGEPTQVRVVQNKEPNHFLSLFKGKFVVHNGGYTSGFSNSSSSSSSSSSNQLYHIKGTTALNTRAIEVEPSSQSLNSNDTFFLLTSSNAYLWYGKGSNQEEKSFAKSISSTLSKGKTIKEINEGTEPEDFWAGLGGQSEYPSSKELYDIDYEPRLFQASSTGKGGGFTIEEIVNYSQDDLLFDSVMILDTYNEVWVWIGKEARKEDKENSFIAALDYVQKAPDGRSTETPVFRVFAGAEPPNFTCHFHGWDNAKASDFTDPYEKRLGKVSKTSSTSTTGAVEKVSRSSIGYSDPSTNKHSLSDLKSSTPMGVDPAKKEEYLSGEEFQSVFGMDFAGFEKLPAWKKLELKKKVGLF